MAPARDDPREGHSTHRRVKRTRRRASKAKKEKALAFRKCLFWWGKLDSNQRSHGQQIYSLPPLAAREFPHIRLLT